MTQPPPSKTHPRHPARRQSAEDSNHFAALKNLALVSSGDEADEVGSGCDSIISAPLPHIPTTQTVPRLSIDLDQFHTPTSYPHLPDYASPSPWIGSTPHLPHTPKTKFS